MLGNLIMGRNENTPKTLTRKGSVFPPPFTTRRNSRRNCFHPLNTPKNMTAHTAYRIWFNEFLSTEFFAEYHNLTLENARKLIREGREIEEQIDKLKQQHTEKQK